MKNLIRILKLGVRSWKGAAVAAMFYLLGAISCLADGTPVVPATAAEVAAGLIHNKYVAPDTLATIVNTNTFFPVSNGMFLFGGGTQPALTNSIASLQSGKNLLLGAGQWDGGAFPIYFPVGIGVIGAYGPDYSEIDIYNTNSDTTTNGGAFCLSDNDTIENIYLNQTNIEQFPIQPIGSQRKNQGSQTAAYLAATSTNVTIRNVKALGQKLHCVVMDATNSMSWKILRCDLSANGTTPVSFGNTPLNAGESANPTQCYVSNYLEVIDTSLAVLVGTGAAVRAGVYVNTPGMAKLQLNEVTITRADSTSPAAAVVVANTGCVVDVNLKGPVIFNGAGGTANGYDIYISGTNNTIICRAGVTNVYDVGVSNVIIWANFNYTPFTGMLNNAVSNLWTLDTNTFATYGSSTAGANKTWFWNSTLVEYTNSANGRVVTNDPATGNWGMYSAGTRVQWHDTLFGNWFVLSGDNGFVKASPINIINAYGFVGPYVTATGTNFANYVFGTNYVGNAVGLTNISASGLILTNIILNPIVSGGYWTNTNSFTGTLTINGTLTDAVSGDPGLNMTNLVSGEFCNATSSLAVAGIIPFTATFRMALNDYFLATNQPSGSGGSTIKSSSFHP